MGSAVFPAPSAAAVPGSTNKPPKFTYSNSYDVSTLSGMASFDGTSAAMTYRRTDGCIYFTSSGHTNVYKFNTSTNTGTYVGNNLSWSGAKDINSAYDGTLYASFSDPTNASVETPQYSTDAGVSWSYLPTASTGTYRGFMTLIDSGEIPGGTGNIVALTSGSPNGGEGASWWENNALATGSSGGVNSTNFNSGYYGGRALFPLRDGDDVKAGVSRIWMGPLGSSANFGVLKAGGAYALRRAYYGVRAISTTKNLYWAIEPTLTGYAASGAFPEQEFKIHKPTTIDSRWIVGVHGTNLNSFQVIDYSNFATMGATSLPVSTISTSKSYGEWTANPVYVSSTKKLYILQGGASSTANTTRMHVYDVTTY